MAYGTIKVDTITFTDAGVDKSVTISGLVQNPTFSGNITVTGTVSGNTIQGQTVSGATITGGAAAFTTVTGGVATITSGVFALGSASNPSISFNGDANSGLYSPGADQVAISTGGTGRLFVNADGTIDIGTTGSTGTPTVKAASNPILGFSNGTNSAYVGLVDTSNRLINFSTNGTTLIQSNSTISLNVVGSDNFTVGTANQERLRITSAGLVGIGTSSPQGAFESAAGNSTNYSVVANNNYSSGDQNYISLNAATTRIGSINRVANDIAVKSNYAGVSFWTGTGGTATQKAVIDSQGRLGVGTASPGQRLHIYETAAATGAFLQVQEVGGQNAYFGVNTSGGSIQVAGANPLQIATNGTERARIDSSGRVGIGTSSPGAQLHTAGGIMSTSTIPGYTATSAFFDRVASYARFASVGPDVSNAGPIRFSQYSSNGSISRDAMSIDGTGRVGIGTTSPTQLLSLAGTSANILLAGTSNSYTTYDINASNVGYVGDANWIFGGSSSDFGVRATSNLVFGIGANERARIDSSGRLGIGNSSPGSYNGSADDLVIGNHTGAHGITIASQNNTSGYIMFADGTTGAELYSGQITYDHVNNRMTFGTVDGTTGLAIDSSQRVGIGTTSPRFLVSLGSTSATSSSTPDTIDLGGTFSSTAGANPKLRLYWDGSQSYGFGVSSGQLDYMVAGAAAHVWHINNSERARIDSSGRLGIGTSSPNAPLDVFASSGNVAWFRKSGVPGGIGLAADTTPTTLFEGVSGGGLNIYGATGTIASPTYTSRLYINSSGNVGIGNTAPERPLDVYGPANGYAAHIGGQIYGLTRGLTIGTFESGGAADCGVEFNAALNNTGFGSFAFKAGSNERARIDSSGRLLVGTSTSVVVAGAAAVQQIVGTPTSDRPIGLHWGGASVAAPYINFSKSRNTTYGSYTIVNNGDGLGGLLFAGDDGTDYGSVGAAIEALVDGTPGANDMPGRLVFSTNPGAPATAPVERMRISSDGNIMTTKTSVGLPNGGMEIRGTDGIAFTKTVTTAFGAALTLNRASAVGDGNLVEFLESEVVEGSISVSGTTVSYNGGHIARWSQLLNNEDPSRILKGTVMSNLDEMCEWGDEDNEQLNKTKVSDLEGDPNVAGVFVSTSFSEEGPFDFLIGMTGDMVIRIAAGTTVQRGDLLMSAGDGTAKPQDDDIIRSKTIAKVTSTNVSCTYDDGSYCVPCVLMAC